MDATIKRVVKNTGFLYIKMGVTMFVSLYNTRLILNTLGASDFGIFNIVGGAIAMLGFLNVAMASATQRFMSYAEGEGKLDKKKSIFNISILIHFCVALFVGIMLFLSGYFLLDGILNIDHDRIFAAKVVYYSMVFSTIFTIMTVPYDAVLNARENMLYYALVGIIESFLKLGVALVVVYTDKDKLITYGVCMAGISMVTMLIMRIYCHNCYPECKISLKRYYDKSVTLEMTRFAGWNLLGVSSGVISGYGSNIILNVFFGTSVNAANGISSQINGQLLVFSSNMLKAINPVIVKNEGGGDRSKMLKASLSACKISVLMYAFFAVPFVLESSFILKIWLKNMPEFTEIFLQLMVVQVLFEEVSLPLTTTISAVGNIRFLNMFTSIIFCLQIGLLYISYKLGYPPETLRVIQIIGAVCITFFKVMYCYKRCGMSLTKYAVEVVLKCTVMILVAYLISLQVQKLFSDAIMRLIVVCLSSMFSFVTLTILFMSKSEKAQIKPVFEKIKLRYE